MRWVQRATTILALTLVLGCHWTVLQTAAWTRMMWDSSRSMSLGEAIVRTFDGRHPCSLCLAVQQGRQAESKNPLAPVRERLRWDFEAPIEPVGRMGGVAYGLPPIDVPTFTARSEAPPKPRPREVGIV